MGSVMSLFPSKISKEDLETALNKAKEIVSSSPVVVFSKTYCGYCEEVKDLLKQLGASYKVIELDTENTHYQIVKSYTGNVEYAKAEAQRTLIISTIGVHSLYPQLESIILCPKGDGSVIHSALVEWTGYRTVPNVFIGGKHIGGCDTVLEKHGAGQLVPLLNDSGAIANNSAQR